MLKYLPAGLDLGSRNGNGYRLAKDVLGYDKFTFEHFEPYGDWSPPYREVGSIIAFLADCEGGIFFRPHMSPEDIERAHNEAFNKLSDEEKRSYQQGYVDRLNEYSVGKKFSAEEVFHDHN